MNDGMGGNSVILFHLVVYDEHGDDPRDEVTDEWQEERWLPPLV